MGRQAKEHPAQLRNPLTNVSQSGENSLSIKLRGQGFTIYESSRPGGPFSVTLQRGKRTASGVADTYEEALQAAYNTWLVSLVTP